MERYPYQGFYLVDTVIDISKDRFARDNITFATMRGISDLTNADLVVCKDVLRYFPNKDVSHYLDYFSTYYKYAIVTNKFFANSYTNLDIPYGAGRALRLGQETFDRRIAVLVCCDDYMARAHLDQACLLATWRAGFSDYKCSRLSASLKDRCSLLEFCPSSKRAGPSAAHRDALVCWGMTRPLISILTPVLNRIDLLGGALDSVRRARGVPSEHLVIDGGSTDGTLSLLRSRPGIRLIEAPGTGIYDALNLGLRAACGDIICQLNSDDLLPAGALEAVAEADAGAGRGADAVRGRAVFFADDAAQNASAATLSAEFPVPLRPRDVALGAPAINALFVRRRLYDRVGYFDPRFRLAADREWLLRAFAAGMRVHEICADVYCFRLHTGSLTINPGRSGSLAIRLEHLEISRRVFGSLDAPATLRRLCRRWFAKEAALLLYLAAVGRYEAGISRALRDTLAVSPQWPVDLPRELLAFAGRRLRRWMRLCPWRLESTSR